MYQMGVGITLTSYAGAEVSAGGVRVSQGERESQSSQSPCLSSAERRAVVLESREECGGHVY